MSVPAVPIENLTARELTDRIKSVAADLWQLIIRAKSTAAWLDLGYGSWQEYCKAEFDTDHLRIPAGDERNRVVRMMTDAGMSTREIEAATGLSHGAVVGTLSRSTNGQNRPEDDHEPPKPQRRRSLPESFRDAAFDLTRMSERIERLADDDRFSRSTESIAAHRGALVRARDVLDRTIAKMARSIEG